MHPTRKSLISSSLSTRFDPSCWKRLDYNILGGGDLELGNPFPADVYYIAGMLRVKIPQVSPTSSTKLRGPLSLDVEVMCSANGVPDPSHH